MSNLPEECGQIIRRMQKVIPSILLNLILDGWNIP
jgi:hypothetical protein